VHAVIIKAAIRGRVSVRFLLTYFKEAVFGTENESHIESKKNQRIMITFEILISDRTGSEKSSF
jgi:hypothetical protein